MKTYKQFLTHLFEDYISDWKEKQRKAGNLTPDNEAEHEEVLNQFKKEKQNLPAKERSLSAHKDIRSIQNAFEKARAARSSSSLQARHDSATPEERAGAETIHDQNGLQVQHIKTKAASCHYGKGTKWCTAAKKDNRFNSYNEDGKFYIVHGKDEKGKPQRYGIHFENGESQNEANLKIPLKEIVKNNPELKNVEAFQGKHPATTSDENFEKHFDSLLREFPRDTINDTRFTKKHVEKILQGTKSEAKRVLMLSKHVANGLVRAKHINDLFSNPYYGYPEHDMIYGALTSPHIKPEHIHEILKTGSAAPYILKFNALQSPYVKPEHIDNILSKPASEFKNIQTDYQDKELKLKALESPYVKPEHIDNILNNRHEDIQVKNRVLVHKANMVKPEHIDSILAHDDTDLKVAIFSDKNLNHLITPKHISNALSDKTEHQTDTHRSVREFAAAHPNATKEHLQTALNDINEKVRNVAKTRLDSGDFK